MPRIFLSVFLCFTAIQAAYAALDSPARAIVQDSVTMVYERGVELARLTEKAGKRQSLSSRFELATAARWKTEWHAPESEADRVRHDGRWYSGLQRQMTQPFTIWGAASGEHFDDRPTKTSAVSSATSVHILRGGGGVTTTPWKPLTFDVGVGGVQDRRIGRIEGGFGIWSRADLEHWDLAGYDQTLSLRYNRETPKRHENSDIIARYENYREFFPGNSNRAEATASVLSRDVYLDLTGQLSRRTEEKYDVRDVLTYDLRKGMRVEMTGDLLKQSTEQEQSGGTTTSLKETQAGFATALAAGNAKANALVSIGLRTVTQTIRGEILQGKKSDLAVQGHTALPLQSSLTARLAVAKYSLDTPNPDNSDDRDELRYTVDAAWSKPLFGTLLYELHGTAKFDHLVYLFSESSANNRWTRFFLAGSTLRHRPGGWFQQTMRVNVSANYQDYDFELDPNSTRSTVFRRITLGDTVSLGLTPRLHLNSHVGYQVEEFGRLFWDSFEEERSDETHSSNVTLELAYQFTSTVRAGAGGIWDKRRGKRFPDLTRQTEEVFQDLESYGPTFFAERKSAKGIFLSVRGRILRQFQLDRNDRWLTLGEASGGFRW